VGGEGTEGDTIGGDRDTPEFLDPIEIEEFDVGSGATAFEVEQEIGPTGNRVYRRIAQLRECLVEGVGPQDLRHRATRSLHLVEGPGRARRRRC